MYSEKEISLIVGGYVACMADMGEELNYQLCLDYLKSLTKNPEIIKSVFDEHYGEDGLNWAHYDIETDSIIEKDKPPKTKKIEYHPCAGWNAKCELCQVNGTEYCEKAKMWFCWRHIEDSELFAEKYEQSDVRRQIEQIANSLLMFKAS
jgi:hypothetical protein